MPARVLIRPATNVYDSPSTSGKVLKSNLPAFNPWYVFEQRDVDLRDPRQPKGWYAIGDSTKDRFGWIEAGNAIEWKSALVVSYTHPGTGDDRRTPTLMFDDLARVRTLMESPDRAALAEGIVKAIENGEKGLQAKYGVAMMEPRRFVDIERTPYILPVLDFEQFRTADRNARFLRIAAAIPQTETETGRGRTTLDQEAVQRQVAQRETTQGTQAATLGLDIKFVLDMTGSMQPYLDGTRDAINRMVRSLTADSSAPVRFGLVGFTDIDRECGDCNFKVARNWTKDELASGEQFVKILESDPTAKALGGGDLPETVFEGVHEAITSRWTENAIRMVVLIGDASSNQLGTDKNRDYSEHTIRSEADAQNVYMMALHIKPRGAEFDTALAEPQFKTMVVNPGQEQPPYIPVPADPRNPAVNRTAILEAVEPVVARLAKELQKVRRGDVSIVAADTDKAVKAESASLGARAEAAAGGTLAAALVSYLGDAAEPPNDVTAWTTDVDLADPTRLALDVRVLLEKRDLEDLTNAIDTILTALRRSRMTESDFFSELQAVVTSGVMARDISVSDATSLAGSGLLPKWLSSLPYKSAIQRLDATTYAALSPDDKVALDRELDAKIRLYKDYFNNSEIWHKLSPKHADLESVYPIRLADLP
ncbi:MAG TPA: vWA domain-containing protein [Azospirillum sp.]